MYPTSSSYVVTSRPWYPAPDIMSPHSADAEAMAAQQAIDEEIIALEAAILALKSRRNTYSSISRILPTEILTEIFVLVSTGVRTPAVRVAGVCRRWREISLAASRMWSSIEISPKDGVELVLLERSNSAPLKISCDPSSYPWVQPRIAVAIMYQLHRIQELRLRLPPDDLLHFLRINAEAGAPILKRLILVADSTLPLSLPRDIMLRDMPSLHHLELVNITIPELPALPHLRYLSLSSIPSSISASRLLSLLQNSPNLEAIHIDGITSDGPIDSSVLPICLPNLMSITIGATRIEDSAVLTNLEYPPAACVTFRGSSMPDSGPPTLLSLTEIYRRFAQANVALTIDKLRLYGWTDHFRMTVLSRGNPKLSLALQIQGMHHHTCLMLGMLLPIEHILALEIEGLQSMEREEWTGFFRRCAGVRDLTLEDVDLKAFQALMKPSSEEAPLPNLLTLRLFNCTLLTRSKDTARFHALKDFLKERKDLGTPTEKTMIGTCCITETAVEELKEFTEVLWDGDEVDMSEAKNHLASDISIEFPLN
ncbi:hypothetical protein EYR36_005950 [Pleurotus pulmonarius]|nr:hypothetical protein EYR36_005950 [Pleurotus pulmonarius]